MDLHNVANALVAPHKGILAADESSGTIKKRFDSISVESTENARREYRNLLFTTPEIEQYISGVILFHETFYQKSDDGTSFPEFLQKKGVIPGIKVDAGTHALPFSPLEKVTEGLDGLSKRLEEYKAAGAQFAKWRAVITIGQEIPTERCIEYNAQVLALYAGRCQEAGLVPIVEPEVLMDGEHSLERCQEVTIRTLTSVFAKLAEYKLDSKGMLLKPNMITSGKDSPVQANIDQVTHATIDVLNQVLPKDLPGVVFLSGGQKAELATQHLNAINKIPHSPYECSFSFGRALQEEALKTWAGKKENIPAAQAAFLNRAKRVSMGRDGTLPTNQ